VKYNHIDFNGEWASTKTVEAFIDHEKHHGLTEQELREIHALIVMEHGGNAEAEKEVVNPENMINHGDNTGGDKPGADDGGKA
jgi:hypothetical protein